MVNKEDVARMAREAEIPGSWDLNWFDPYLDSFAARVAAHEREECAKVAENGLIGHTIAKAIRARVEK